MKLISKCCVCGTTYGVTTVSDGSDTEKVSHGYCSKACAGRTEVQIMLWSDQHGMFVLERAYVVEERLYFGGRAVNQYVESMGKVFNWDTTMGFYDTQLSLEATLDRKERMTVVKQYARANHAIIKM